MMKFTFSFAHAGFRRFLGDWFAGEYLDPKLTRAMRFTRDGDTAGLDVIAFDHAVLQGFESEFPKGQSVPPRSNTAQFAALVNEFGAKLAEDNP